MTMSKPSTMRKLPWRKHFMQWLYQGVRSNAGTSLRGCWQGAALPSLCYLHADKDAPMIDFLEASSVLQVDMPKPPCFRTRGPSSLLWQVWPC